MEQVISKVAQFIAVHELVERGDRVLLSLSAGKDSMFLLRAMLVLSGDLKFTISIFHLNHMTRGPESDREEEHVVGLARENGLDLFAEHHDFRKDRPPGVSFEEHARNVRYRILDEIAASSGFNKIATAHTFDDQAETILLRILSGTGIHGLRGIRPRRNNIIRPLLTVTSAEVYAYLKAHDIVWHEDSSNRDLSFSRNFIRHRVLPLVRQKFRTADDSLVSLGEVADETMSLLDSMFNEIHPGLFEASDAALLVDAGLLTGNPPAFNHAISSAIRERFGHQVNRSMLGKIHSGYQIDRANVELYADSRIRVDKVFLGGKSMLKIYPVSQAREEIPEWEYPVSIGQPERKLAIPEIGLSLTIKISDFAEFEKFRENQNYIFVSMESRIKSVYIRNRRAGDRIRTEEGTKKIKDLLIEKKLDAISKDRVPLLVADSKIMAFMPGLLYGIPNRVSVDFLVDKNSQKVLAVIKN
ncbi:MAG: tRNA lysidine(34) synthetase TilS [Spirochaetes bacterium]|nr:tRNA lysidine(34) synthetase TilS [Spirochaetota bacterium]